MKQESQLMSMAFVDAVFDLHTVKTESRGAEGDVDKSSVRLHNSVVVGK